MGGGAAPLLTGHTESPLTMQGPAEGSLALPPHQHFKQTARRLLDGQGPGMGDNLSIFLFLFF